MVGWGSQNWVVKAEWLKEGSANPRKYRGPTTCNNRRPIHEWRIMYSFFVADILRTSRKKIEKTIAWKKPWRTVKKSWKSILKRETPFLSVKVRSPKKDHSWVGNLASQLGRKQLDQKVQKDSTIPFVPICNHFWSLFNVHWVPPVAKNHVRRRPCC